MHLVSVLPATKTQEHQQLFTYLVPPSLQNQIKTGIRVKIPFGRRTIAGVVIQNHTQPPSNLATHKIKPLQGITPYLPPISQQELKKAYWLSTYYHSPLKNCLETINRYAFKAPPKLPSSYHINLQSPLPDTLPRLGHKQKSILDELQKKDTLITTTLNASLQSLQSKNIISVKKQTATLSSLLPLNAAQGPTLQDENLTDSQQKAINSILKSDWQRPFLLHGVTGSGKTEVYLHTIKELLNQEPTTQYLILLPEISLTPQTLQRFINYFPQKVAPFHSKLSQQERYLIYQETQKGHLNIIIGSRSALFLPFKNLKMIMIDEEHETSYKQDKTPYYHTITVAEKFCRNSKTGLILGSATPSIFSYAKAQHGHYKLLNLPKPIRQEIIPSADSWQKKTTEQDNTPIQIIDLRLENKQSRLRHLSQALLEEIEINLQKQELSLIFLNRRGYSPCLLCQDCGISLNCPDCEIAFTYHSKTTKRPLLICHHCGQTAPPPSNCPNCQSQKLRLVGAGTQKIEEELQKHFPQATISRLDTDTTSRKNSYQKIYEQIHQKKIDILIGTQIIAKGWDIPHATLVGVILAEQSLYIPDFSAGERTFQLLTQILGRVGRASLAGRAIVQTYDPENFYLQAAIQKNYQALYQTEMQTRKKFHYPPFVRLAKIIIKDKNETKAFQNAQAIKNTLQKLPTNNYPPRQILGPTPAFIPKKNNLYNLHLILKAKNLSPFLPHIPSNYIVDIQPTNLL